MRNEPLRIASNRLWAHGDDISKLKCQITGKSGLKKMLNSKNKRTVLLIVQRFEILLKLCLLVNNSNS